jgi:16S rRNA (uracil1498-N3)-methyltransferase
MQLFYTQNIQNGFLQLEEEEFRHLKVLRKNEGDELVVTNGQGALYKAVITDLAKHYCTLQIIEAQQFEASKHPLHVAVAPTKNTDRIEWLVEKLVEIGVDEISFIQCKHSERKVQKTDRLKKIALSAMKQSLKYYLPKINELVGFDVFMAQTPATQNLFIGYCETPATVFLPAQPFTHAGTVVLIGPEGDFSADEVSKAQKAGYVPISLGSSRLRTETAAMVAATLINAKFETQQ